MRKFIKLFFTEKQREIIRYWIKSIPAYFYQKNLSKLALLYGTDKFGDHTYTPIYERYFGGLRTNHLTLLEIGIGGGENTKYGGNSLKMWAKYFCNSQIIGIDLYDKSLLNYRRIKTYQGNQADSIFLQKFENLDIIIDDGSHINSDIIYSFETLFPKLNIGGYYCIEDTQTSYIDSFLDKSYPTSIAYFQNLNSEEIDYIHFHKDLIVLRKK